MTASESPGQASGSGWVRRATRSGALAALAMVVLQMLWRLLVGSGGAPSFPETVVQAVARLTPLGLFGWATENLGSIAQNTLFAATLVGIVVAGHEAGGLAGRWANEGRFGAGPRGRLLAGLVVAGLLALVALLAIMPLAGLGFFGSGSRHAPMLVLQTLLTFAFWGAAWSWLAGPSPAEAAALPLAAEGAPVSRRAAIESGAAGIGALALLAGAGVLGWRLARPNPAGRPDPAVAEQAAREIEATAVARSSGAAGSTPEATGSGPAAASTPAAAPEAATLPSFEALEADDGLTPRLTPLGEFYHVSKNISDPVVEAEGWALEIAGLVETPTRWTLEELTARATTRNISTLACISNELNGDLIGTAEWTGVPLADLLAEVGVKPEAVDLKFTAADDYEDSIPVADAMDPDNLLVVGMNGAPLPPDHGFPARLILPAIYGMKNVKWLERIELVDHDFKGFWQTRGWSDPAPYQIWGRIDAPASGADVPQGPAVAAGVAFAGDRGVSRVEVSLDEGATWADAELEPALNPPFTWVRWKFGFDAEREAELWIRVTDGEGNVAPQREDPPLPDGATGWPARKINVTVA